MNDKKAIGVRENNPGNIVYNPRTKWQGLADPPHSGRFCRFKTPVYGIRALARVLIVYQDKHGLETIHELISRWAPPIENDTLSYAHQVKLDIARATKRKITLDTDLDLHEYHVIKAMVCGIIEHENGLVSYKEEYSDAQIDKHNQETSK